MIRTLTIEEIDSRIEDLLDELDDRFPQWRSQLPSCKHVFCCGDYDLALVLDRLHTALWFQDEGDKLWEFAEMAERL
jgi:hypothetical protein